MSNELLNINKKLVATIEKNGIGDIIKPLTKEIELFDIFASESMYVDKKILKELKVGEKITLRRDINNKFDDKAVSLLNANEEKIGCIGEEDTLICSRLIDAGKLLIGKVKNLEIKSEIPSIMITIYLVDF